MTDTRIINRIIAPLFLGMLGAGCICAQTPARAVPAFDVVSVKLADPNSRMTEFELDPGRLRVRNAPFKLFLKMIYNVKFEDQMTGLPSSIGSQRFDIEAKVNDALQASLDKMSNEEGTAETNRMVQAMLEDRFHMQVNRRTKELSVYALVIAKGGLKIAPSAVDASTSEVGTSNSERGSSNIGDTSGANSAPRAMSGNRFGSNMRHLAANGLPISSLVAGLSRQPELHGRIVVDKTGLTGKYDWSLRWTPEDATGDPAADAPPSFFTAIQEQLGLKLEPQKGPVEVLVIEHIEMPSAN